MSSSQTHRILRFHGRSGEFLDVFVDSTNLVRPFSIVFDHAGVLYVSSGDRVLRFAGDGAPLGAVVQLPEGGVPVGLAMLDGRLLIADFGAHRLWAVEVDGGDLEPLSEEGLHQPENLVVGPGA